MIGIKLNNRNVKNFEKFEEEVNLKKKLKRKKRIMMEILKD